MLVYGPSGPSPANSGEQMISSTQAELIARLNRVIRSWLDLHAAMLAAPDPTSLTPAEADALDIPDEGLGPEFWDRRKQATAAYEQSLAERLETVRFETCTVPDLLPVLPRLPFRASSAIGKSSRACPCSSVHPTKEAPALMRGLLPAHSQLAPLARHVEPLILDLCL